MARRNEERSYKLDTANNMDNSCGKPPTKMRKFLKEFSVLALISVIEVILVSFSINKVSSFFFIYLFIYLF